MTINSKNIEAYLLDYLEGNLDPVFAAELMAFMAEHPEYEKYLPDYDKRLSLSDSRLFYHKELLKKDFPDLPEITPGNFEEFCIAACEGILTPADMSRLSEYIARDPDKMREFDLYRRIRLQPDLSLQFPDKQVLKKTLKPVNYRYLYLITGIAASLAVILLLVFRKAPVTEVAESLPAKDHKTELTVRESTALPVLTDNDPGEVTAVTDEPVLTVVTDRIKPPAPIEPLTAVQIEYRINLTEIPVPSLSHKEEPSGQKRLQADYKGTDDRSPIARLFSRVDFWKTAEKAITGFNYLTESQLSVDKTTDERGKLTTLLIEGESYSTGIKFK